MTPYSFTVTNNTTNSFTGYQVWSYSPINLACDKQAINPGETFTFTFDDFATKDGKKVGFQLVIDGSFNFFQDSGSTCDGALVTHTLSDVRINVGAAPGYEISADVPHTGWAILKGYDD